LELVDIVVELGVPRFWPVSARYLGPKWLKVGISALIAFLGFETLSGDDGVDGGDKPPNIDEGVEFDWPGGLKVDQLDLVGGFVDHEIASPYAAMGKATGQVQVVQQTRQLLHPRQVEDDGVGLKGFSGEVLGAEANHTPRVPIKGGPE
jgi:hypothetical protein